MSGSISLFPKTILAMDNKLEKLRKKFKIAGEEDTTGASTRLLDPDRVSMFENICTLENLLARSRPLSRPDQNSSAQIGHRVTMVSQDDKELRLHLCSELDVKYLVGKDQLPGRCLSVDSPLGIVLLGKSVGNKVGYGKQNFRITDIRVSEYL